MDTTTINGLHSCKPGNEPQIGQVKLMVVQHMTSKKSGKPYLKIKNANAENGGTPHRILSAEPTGFTDANGNISFNIEVEVSTSQPSTVQNLRATMQQGEPAAEDWPDGTGITITNQVTNEPESSVQPQNGNGRVSEARKHLMQSCNLLNLCIAAVDKAIAPGVPPIAQTPEFFQAQVATLFIESSRAGYIQNMPTTPIQ